MRLRKKKRTSVDPVKLYELRVCAHSEAHHFTTEHDFSLYPEVETVKALLEETVSGYQELYGEEPEKSYASLLRTSEKEPIWSRNHGS